MKIEFHIKKYESFLRTAKKLDYSEDYETLIEDFLLAAAHLVNAALHKSGVLREDNDIKHNRLYGSLKEEHKLGEKTEEVAALILSLEQLRPSHVYGRGENGQTAKKAEEALNQIKKICEEIIYGRQS
ncbi:HEPN domain-containing protein [Candidatus Woesearchaeota archaeon]|nr:HEPN domain-containing protein [Candidatus Woesearchaeota archaeon]